LFPEDYCDLLEVRGAVALQKVCVEELVEAWEEDVERLMQDAVGDTITSWSFIRSCSAHYFLDLLAGEYGSDWLANTKVIGWRIRK